MVKVISLFIAFWLFGSSFDQTCLPCHQKMNAPLKPIFFDYLLNYSSERRVKEAIKEFLLHPDPKKQLYKKQKLFIHTIDPQKLQKAIDEYWERYKVIGKIK